MISDWSAELNKGPNPSRSVDEANALEEQLTSKKLQLKSKKDKLDSLMDAWQQQEQLMLRLESRVERIHQLVGELEGKPEISNFHSFFLDPIENYDEGKLGALSSETNENDIENELNQLQEYERIFSDGNVMKEYIECRITSIETKLTTSRNEASSVKRRISDSEREVESEAILEWIVSTEAILGQINTTTELSQFTEKLQSYANKLGSEEDLQGKLYELDSQIRQRKESIEKATAKDDSICIELERHLTMISTTTGFSNPAEFQVAQSYVQSLTLDESASSKLVDLKAQLEASLKARLLPENTQTRVENVENDLDKAELELANAEVHVVALDGATIVEARDAVIRIYEMLVEVKNNLEDLIKMKRELQRSGLLETEGEFTGKLVALRERFNQIGDRITQNKATLSKSIRRIQKVKKAVDETDSWAKEVNEKMARYTPDDRLRLRDDAANRLEEMKEATNDCVNKIRQQLNADTSQLESDVTKGLDSCALIVTRLGDDNGSSSETAVIENVF